MKRTEDQIRKEILQLLVKHRPELFAFVLALVRDFNRAEDVLQEVAVVICERWSEFKPDTNFLAWARRIAKNKIFSLQRKEGRYKPILSEAATEQIEKLANEQTATAPNGELQALRECIKKLDEKPRRIITLRYQEGSNCGRIAKSLSMTVSAIHMSLSRIRSRLADCIATRLAQEVNG